MGQNPFRLDFGHSMVVNVRLSCFGVEVVADVHANLQKPNTAQDIFPPYQNGIGNSTTAVFRSARREAGPVAATGGGGTPPSARRPARIHIRAGAQSGCR